MEEKKNSVKKLTPRRLRARRTRDARTAGCAASHAIGASASRKTLRRAPRDPETPKASESSSSSSSNPFNLYTLYLCCLLALTVLPAPRGKSAVRGTGDFVRDGHGEEGSRAFSGREWLLRGIIGKLLREPWWFSRDSGAGLRLFDITDGMRAPRADVVDARIAFRVFRDGMGNDGDCRFRLIK